LGAPPKAFKTPSRQHGAQSSFDEHLVTPPSNIPRRLAALPELSHDFQDYEHVRFEHSQPRSGRRRHDGSRGALMEPSPSADDELDDIMEFEHRKKAAIASWRRIAGNVSTTPLRDVHVRSSQTRTSSQVPSPTGIVQVRSSQDPQTEYYEGRFRELDDSSAKVSGSNPHRSRYLKAVQRLSHGHSVEDDQSLEQEPLETAADALAPQTTLSQIDPRAYFIRQRARGSKGGFLRKKSLKLPLESLVAGTETFELQVTINGFDTNNDLEDSVRQVAENDPYIKTGKFELWKFEKTTTDLIYKWETTLKNLIQKLYRENEGTFVSDLQIDVAGRMQNRPTQTESDID
jgi:hypothetical protein